MKTETIYAWKIVDKYGNIIQMGVADDNGVEFSLDGLPFGWCGERHITNVAETMEKEEWWIQDGLKFHYKAYSLSDNLEITQLQQ